MVREPRGVASPTKLVDGDSDGAAKVTTVRVFVSDHARIFCEVGGKGLCTFHTKARRARGRHEKHRKSIRRHVRRSLRLLT
jgi:hypothetical protein